jgi:hypothetical protein
MLAKIPSASAYSAAPERPVATAIDNRAPTITRRTKKPLPTPAEVGFCPCRDDPLTFEVDYFWNIQNLFRDFANIDLSCEVTNHMYFHNIRVPLAAL